MNAIAATIQTHPGTSGNHSPMYVATAVMSAIATTASSSQKTQPTMNPAKGPRKDPAYCAKDPATGWRTAISPRARMTMKTMNPATR